MTEPLTGFSPAQAAELLGVSRATVYNLIDSGALRRIKIGRRAFIPREDVARVAAEGAEVSK